MNSKEELQKKNDLIAVFCGGVLEVNPFFGEQYRFDHTNGFGYGFIPCHSTVISRKGLCFDYDYNHLIPVIKFCGGKAISVDLENAYKEIVADLLELNDILPAFEAVVRFIDLYNTTISGIN